MQRRQINPNQMSSVYDATMTKYPADNSHDINYDAWVPADTGFPVEMPPYQMNCKQIEYSTMDSVQGIYYENHPVVHHDNGVDSIPMTTLDESVFLENNSPDDFDFDQSYQRLIHNAETIRNEITIKQCPQLYVQTQISQSYANSPTFPPQLPEMSQTPNSIRSSERDLDMEKELRRLRNNEASRRSRREKKRRFMEIERRVEEMKASNKRLTDLVQELDIIIEEAKDILLTVRPNADFHSHLPNWEPY